MAFIIKHIPNGITPYKDDRYERKPKHPKAEEPVVIKCVATECDPSVEIKLYLKANGVESIVESARSLYLEKGEMNCEFEVGKFLMGDCVTYYFEGTCHNETIRTKIYSFSPHRTDVGLKLAEVYFENNCVVCSIKYEKELFLLIYFKKGLIRTVLCESRYVSEHIGDEASLKPINESNYLFKSEGVQYTLEMQTIPLSFSIKNSKGLTLLKSNIEQIQLTRDHEDHIYSIEWAYETRCKEFFGFGERYDTVNQKGKNPDGFVIEEFGHQGDKTYLPVPFFMTEMQYGFFTDTTFHTYFDLNKKKDGRVSIKWDTDPNVLNINFYILFGEPKEMLRHYYELTGYPKLPPKWAFGPWMSANGWNTQIETLEQVAYMQQYECPATVLVLEAWADEITFYTFNDANYLPVEGGEANSYLEYTFDQEGKWDNPKAMIDHLHKNNLKLILWQIPVIKYEKDHQNEQHKRDEAYVIQNKLCIFNDDDTPYRIPDNWFFNSLVIDFTNPMACEWWFNKRRYLLEELGVDGFKTDGGEFIYDDTCVFYNGKTGAEIRNLYPNLYQEAYTNFIGKDRVLFSRAGYTGAQNYPLHWAGDKISSFEEFKSTLIAGLSANISGVPFWSFDIGGFAGPLPTTELFIRSAQVAAFSPIMQFHAEPRNKGVNNDRTPWNISKVHGDEDAITIYRKYANIRMNLLPYIYHEAVKVSKNGLAMMKPLFYDFSADPATYDIETAYMFGEGLLVSPVTEAGMMESQIYLPQGEWTNLFTGKKFKGNTQVIYPCPLNEIPVFIKENSPIALNLNDDFEFGGGIGNATLGYTNLCFLLTGCFVLEHAFEDDLGNEFKLSIENEQVQIKHNSSLDAIYIILQENISPKKMTYVKQFNDFYHVWRLLL
ncbi:MAG: hypothetical protein H7X94_11740 [Vallitaleaceae bacterium]|nr:hypothetical protein [Vallitaleaceae bacterium]